MTDTTSPHEAAASELLEKTLALVAQGFYAGTDTDLKATTRDPEVIRQWAAEGKLRGISTARFGEDEHLAVVAYRRVTTFTDEGEVIAAALPEYREVKAKGMLPRTWEIFNQTHGYLIYRSKRLRVKSGLLGEALLVCANCLIDPALVIAPGPMADAPEWMLEGAQEDKPEVELRYKPTSIADLVSAPPPAWLIRDLLPSSGLAVIFGEPGSGKSFLVLDMLASIARGESWGAQRTKKGVAVYVGLEAQVNSRIAAYLRHHSLTPDDLQQLHVIQHQPLSLATPANTKQFITELQLQGIEPDIIAIDTLARALPGSDENSSTDMGAAIACAGMLTRAFGCLCVLVHHSGKDASRGARGHSSLLGAADAELAVTYDKTANTRMVRASKMKDGADGVAWVFQLTSVDLGCSLEDGERHTSLVVTDATRVYDRQSKAKRTWTPHRTNARDALRLALEASSTRPVDWEGTESCSLDAWRTAYFDLVPLGESLQGVELRQATNTRSRNFANAVEWLTAEKLVRVEKKNSRSEYSLVDGG